jgi:hypothetical protein
MLDFSPRRIGHACYFEEDHWKKLKSNNIPVSFCEINSLFDDDVHYPRMISSTFLQLL